MHRAIIAASIAAIPAAAFAADNTASGDPALVLGEINVRASQIGPLPTKRMLTSVDILGGDLIESQNVSHSWRLFNQIPGVQLTEFGQGTTSGKLSFRGFNGEGEINAVKLLIDGIPSNSNDGNMPYLDMIFTQDIDSIEVVRGTNDPRYGLHNIAGNANINTRIGGNDTRVRAAYGSFNTREIQASKGIEQGGFSQNYFIAGQKIDGYRDHADSDKTSLAGKWFYAPDNQSYRVGLIARHYENTADEPGYLTFAQSRSNPEQSQAHNATDGGKRVLDQLSGHLDASLNERLSLAAKAYMNKIDDRRWVRFSAGASQQERFVDETHYGAMGGLTYRPSVDWAQSLAIEGGVDAQWQQNHSDRYTTVNRARTAQTRNQDFDFDIYGAYVQAVIQLNNQWRLVPGYRVDTIRGNYRNLLNGKTYGINDYGIIGQPKFSMVYSPNPHYSFYGNVGRTFQVGVGTASYKVNQSNDLDPSVNDGWELGVKLAPAAGVEGRVALWQQTASNEARRKLNDPNNDAENIGKTRRRGLDLQLAAKVAEQVRVWGGLAFQNSKILRADAASPASLDKEIDHVPRRLLSAGADYQATPDLKLSMFANHQGDYYLERTNATGRFGGYTLLNASANYRLRRDTFLDVQIRNLTDRYYEYVWHDGTQSLHAPGDRRGIYGSINVRF